MNDHIHKIFDSLSVGVAGVDASQRIVGVNRRFFEWFGSGLNESETPPQPASKTDGDPNFDGLFFDLLGVDFYRALNDPVFLSGDYCPLHFFEAQKKQEKQRLAAAEERRKAREEKARERTDAPTKEEIEAEQKILRAEKEREERWKAENRTTTNSTIEVKFSDERTEKFELTVSKFSRPGTKVAFLVELKKVPKRRDREKMLLALRKAGDELTSTCENAFEYSADKRKALLQDLTGRHMRDVLNFDVVEIRLLEGEKNLTPFLSFGMRPEVTEKELVASADGQGITGYVASSGEPYFCEDTENDFLYIPGAVERARCSITVPLLYHGNVVGVCNVESATPDAFTRADLDFLQLYANDLARAVQTLKLISLESEHTRRFCGEQIRDQFYADADDACERALSLLDEATRLEANGRLDADFVEQIRRATQSVRQLRVKIGDVKKDYFNPKTPPSENEDQRQTRTTLRDRRVLIVNPNRVEARLIGEVFESFDCAVDVAFETKTALQLLKSNDFELVVCDLFPDGKFFDKIDPAAKRNRRDVNRYHIHKKHYEEPVEGDETDAQTRREIMRQIKDERRLDAFFLRLEIDKMGLNPPPVYALTAPTVEHDSTHVVSDLGEFYQARGEKPPFAFLASAFTNAFQKRDDKEPRSQQQSIITATTQRLAKDLRRRDALIPTENGQ